MMAKEEEGDSLLKLFLGENLVNGTCRTEREKPVSMFRKKSSRLQMTVKSKRLDTDGDSLANLVVSKILHNHSPTKISSNARIGGKFQKAKRLFSPESILIDTINKRVDKKRTPARRVVSINSRGIIKARSLDDAITDINRSLANISFTNDLPSSDNDLPCNRRIQYSNTKCNDLHNENYSELVTTNVFISTSINELGSSVFMESPLEVENLENQGEEKNAYGQTLEVINGKPADGSDIPQPDETRRSRRERRPVSRFTVSFRRKRKGKIIFSKSLISQPSQETEECISEKCVHEQDDINKRLNDPLNVLPIIVSKSLISQPNQETTEECILQKYDHEQDGINFNLNNDSRNNIPDDSVTTHRMEDLRDMKESVENIILCPPHKDVTSLGDDYNDDVSNVNETSMNVRRSTRERKQTQRLIVTFTRPHRNKTTTSDDIHSSESEDHESDCQRSTICEMTHSISQTQKTTKVDHIPAVSSSTPGKENIDDTGWSQIDMALLKQAYNMVDPISYHFWDQVAAHVPQKSAEECRIKWFSLVKTPTYKRNQSSKKTATKDFNTTDSREDDIFDSTPLRVLFHVNSARKSELRNKSDLMSKISSISLVENMMEVSPHVPSSEYTQERSKSKRRFSLEFRSPIAHEGDEIMESSASYDSDDLFCVHDTSPILCRAGNKGYIQRLKAEWKEDDVKRNKLSKKSKKRDKWLTMEDAMTRDVMDSVDVGDVHMNGVLSPGGTLHIEAPDDLELEELFVPSGDDFSDC